MSRFALPAQVQAAALLSLVAGCGLKHGAPPAADFHTMRAELSTAPNTAVANFMAMARSPEQRAHLIAEFESQEFQPVRIFFRDVHAAMVKSGLDSYPPADCGCVDIVHALVLTKHQQVEAAAELAATAISRLNTQDPAEPQTRELLASAYQLQTILGLELLDPKSALSNAQNLVALLDGHDSPVPSPSCLVEADILNLGDSSLWELGKRSGLAVSPAAVKSLISVLGELDPKHPTHFETTSDQLYRIADKFSAAVSPATQLWLAAASPISPPSFRDLMSADAGRRLSYVLGVADADFGRTYTDFDPVYAEIYFRRGGDGLRAATWSHVSITTAPQERANNLAATAYESMGAVQFTRRGQELRNEAANLATRIAGHTSGLAASFPTSSNFVGATLPVREPSVPQAAESGITREITNYAPAEDPSAPLRLILQGDKFLRLVEADLENAGTPIAELLRNRHELLGAIAALRAQVARAPDSTQGFQMLLSRLEAVSTSYNADPRVSASDQALINKVSGFKPVVGQK